MIEAGIMGMVAGIGSVSARFEMFKVGGMRFIKVRYWGDWKVCISICTTTK